MTRKNRRTGGSARANPDKIRALFAAAVDAMRAGNAEEGRRLLEKADKLAPGNASILFNLGYAHHLAGRPERAVGYYRRCLDRDPSMVDGWVNLATSARLAGQLDTAVDALETVISRRPNDVSALNDLGNLMVEMGQPKRALEYFQRALEGGGDRSEIRPNLAVALASAGRAADAELELRQAVEEDPENGAARSMLVAMLDEQNRVDEAEAVLLDTPGGLVDTDQLLLAGNLQLRQGKISAGEANYKAVLARHPGHPLALNNLGLVRVFRADPVEAEKCFRSALSAERRYAEPWRNIVALKHYGDCGDDDIESMKRLDRDSSLTDSSRIHLGFALGKSLDDCGRYDEAFAHYDRANTLRRAQTPFDADALDSHAERIRSVFDRQFLAERRRWGSGSAMPVYIVGMPRTGTTLLEQILSAHPAFFGAGELLLVNQVIARLEKASTGGAVEAYPECCASLTPEAVARVSGDYLGVLESLTNDPAVERVSDKMPYNFFHLGFVGLLFPGARIIHSTRNILDTCLSAYFNYFPRGLDFTYSFDDLVAFCRIYREMIAHWRDRVGLDILDVSYEALVAEPRRQVGRVLDHIGLAWHEDVLEFHASRREVQTLSAWQVRRPLSEARVARWRRYESHIQPLIDGLREIGEDVSDEESGR